MNFLTTIFVKEENILNLLKTNRYMMTFFKRIGKYFIKLGDL